MCNLFGSKAEVDTSYQDNAKAEADRARAEEKARQARISTGMQSIADIFEGAEEVEGTPASWGNNLGGLFGSGGIERLFGGESFGSILGGTKATDGTPARAGIQPFLDQRRSAMEGVHLPQLDTKYEQKKDDITFALARAGLGTSTAAGQKQADLSEAFALERGKIFSDIQGNISGATSKMQDQRAALEAQLRASGDASAATNAALARTLSFSKEQDTINPLGNIFMGLAQGIGSAKNGYGTGQVNNITQPLGVNYGMNVG